MRLLVYLELSLLYVRERVWSGKWEVSVNTAGVFICRHSEVSGKVVSTDMGGASFADFPHLFNLNTHFSIAVFVILVSNTMFVC